MRTVGIGKKHMGIIAACVVGLVILLGILNSAAITRQLNDWKLLPQPERLSELYYKDHTKLPTVYTPGAAQQFSFIVHNLEYRQTAYSYTVFAESEDGSQRQQLAGGDFGLPHGGYGTSDIKLTPPDLGQRVKIVTTLSVKDAQNTTQTIHYWVVREGM